MIGRPTLAVMAGFIVAFATIFSPLTAMAQAPALLPIQGALVDSTGAPLDGDVTVRFALYDGATGDGLLHDETQTVTCEEGMFTAYIGDVTVLDLGLFRDSGAVFLELTVEGEVMAPRFELATVPYAAYADFAEDASMLDGLAVDELALAEHAHDWSDLGGVPTTFPPEAHGHGWADLTGVPTEFPPEDHGHGWADLTGVPTEFPPEDHGHGWSELTGVPAGLLDGDQDTTYTAGTGLELVGTQFRAVQADMEDWARGVCFDTEAELTSLLDDNYLSSSYVPPLTAWDDITGMPFDFSDGIDDEGVISATAPLTISGGDVALSSTGCPSDGVWTWVAGAWSCRRPSGGTLGDLGCDPGDFLTWNGTSWTCTDTAPAPGEATEGRFVGFTSATYTGNIGGRWAAHAACDFEYPGSSFCHASEYILTNSTAAPPAAGAWIEASVDENGDSSIDGSELFGRDIGNSCSNWSIGTSSYRSYYVNAQAGISSLGDCDEVRPLACCRGAIRTRFAGFTSATMNGGIGGRHAAHAACDSEFAGAHLCHAAEYLRARSMDEPPAAGAWIDSSVDVNGDSSYDAGPRFGRDLGNSCSNWSIGTSSYRSAFVNAQGGLSSLGDCDEVRSLACCY